MSSRWRPSTCTRRALARFTFARARSSTSPSWTLAGTLSISSTLATLTPCSRCTGSSPTCSSATTPLHARRLVRSSSLARFTRTFCASGATTRAARRSPSLSAILSRRPPSGSSSVTLLSTISTT
eukprot:Mycagemm_TRINITY_DN10344_c1_g13::TRINITY_DN10344_c1_g13_i1::g.757::m.757 type:complete len:125 gc:universal TRINITY_DN10344_c1_g13_i1:225-599(+)